MNAFTWLRRSPRLAVVIVVVGIAAVAAAVAYAATAPAIQTSTPSRRTRSRTSTCCASRSATTTATRSAPASSPPTATTPRRRGSRRRRRRTLARRTRPRRTASGHEGDRPGRRRHHAGDLELRDLQQLGVQPDDERHVRHRAAVPGRARHGGHGRRRPKAQGYAIFFLTGRPAAQEAATLGNLTADGVGVDAGYPAPTTLSDGEDGLFTKPAVANYPDYLQAACAGEPERRPARPSTTSRRRGPTSSRSATTSWPTSATSSATSGRVRRPDLQDAEPELLPAVAGRVIGCRAGRSPAHRGGAPARRTAVRIDVWAWERRSRWSSSATTAHTARRRRSPSRSMRRRRAGRRCASSPRGMRLRRSSGRRRRPRRRLGSARIFASR